MNKEDFEKLEGIEQQLLNSGELLSVRELSDFPFTSYDELKLSHSNKDISFGSNYHSEFLQVIGTKSDNMMHVIWVSLPILIIVANIVLAIVFKKWILLLGIPFAIVGFISSSPFSPQKNIVSGLGGLMFTASFFFLDWTWSMIIGSMLFAQIFTMTAREQYRMIVEQRALQSEVLFCYMFKRGLIVIKDNKSNRTFFAK